MKSQNSDSFIDSKSSHFIFSTFSYDQMLVYKKQNLLVKKKLVSLLTSYLKKNVLYGWIDYNWTLMPNISLLRLSRSLFYVVTNGMCMFDNGGPVYKSL